MTDQDYQTSDDWTVDAKLKRRKRIQETEQTSYTNR